MRVSGCRRLNERLGGVAWPLRFWVLGEVARSVGWDQTALVILSVAKDQPPVVNGRY